MDLDALPSAGEIPKSVNNGTKTQAAILGRLWIEKYKSLADYKEENRQCNVTTSQGDAPLANWAGTQRSLQRAGSLRKDREQLLNDLGFVWRKPLNNYKEWAEEQWMEKYKRLIVFYKQNGHVRVSVTHDKPLAAWVTHQRSYQQAGMLQQTREQLLTKIEFVWHKSEPHTKKLADLLWMDNYKRLVAFQKCNEHLQVSASDDKALALWVTNQRSYQRAGTLSEDRKQLLNDLGFVWRISAPHNKQLAESRWMDRYNRLVAFHDQHGHFRVPSSESKELNVWMNN